ncbi:MAG: ABC transporter substrate-binding protein [Acetobacteraceae bacterium]|nr:ABC transporter substrate-binding protein [Acetobacteraceae bacterium]
MRLWPIATIMLAAAPLLAIPAHAAGTLRYALDFDFDTFDPARSGSYIERVVNTAMCDQLIDVDPQLKLVPQLATSWEWSADKLALTLHLRAGVVFSDGAPFDAEAVRANLERYRTAPYSFRRTELKSVTGVDVVDKLTVRIRLSEPFAPLLALLANRSGTMLSPRILGQTSEEIAAHPVCAGPFTLQERVAQDHVTLKRFPGYWDAANVHLDGIEFKIMTDSTVRLVNLQSGQLDVANRLAATDVAAVQANKNLRVVSSPSLGFEMISFNLDHGPKADTPFGRDVRVREAFAKSIDRTSLNQVVFEGRMIPSDQTETPGSLYWNPAYPVPARDLAGAKALLAQAGVPHPKVTLNVTNSPTDVQVGEVIQSMAGEAGFDVSVNKGEAVAMTEAAMRGDYQTYLVIWSGRPDPDGNLSLWMRCGAPLNWTGWCNKAMDAALDRGATAPDEAGRIAAYRDATAIWMRDLPYMVLYHFNWFWGVSDKVEGFHPRPDGVVRMIGVSLR